MNPAPKQLAPGQGMPAPVERLLNGLWRQREELGLIADELLAIFQHHGLNPPQDEEHHI
jgi:hypothetical protein